ncbi:MAG: GFA family protein [Pseudomonadales bacterium]
MSKVKTLSGGCHCGQVRFQLSTEWPVHVFECNCSICEAVGFLHLFVSSDEFTLLTPWEALTTYTFNTGVAQHWFCKTCGVKSFYRPRSHPDGISVNARCLDDVPLSELTIEPFDGRNWEQNVDSIR